MLKILIFSFSCLLVLLLPVSCKENSELLFVQILFRHGDRAPINLYPNDPNPESFWKEGLGKLTLLGRKQHYALGKFLKHMYENFTTSSPNEINVISSDCDRCMKSAETNVASFFAPSSQWQFEKELRWQPISILYIPRDEDKYLETDSYCPRATEEQVRLVNSPEGQAFIAEHKEMFENLTMESGSPITNWTSASYLHDVLFIEKKYNLSIPGWVSPWWEELERVADLSFFWSFNSPLLHRLRAGPILGKMIDLMKMKIANAIPEQKIQIYSAHDTNIAALLDALHLYNMRQPPYCATLLLELHRMGGGGGMAVRLLYLNASTPETGPQPPPHLLPLPGCPPDFCPLEQFVEATRHLIPDDWEAECRLPRSLLQELQEKNLTLGLFFAILSVFIITMSIYSVWKVYFKDREKYSYHLMPLN